MGYQLDHDIGRIARPDAGQGFDQLEQQNTVGNRVTQHGAQGRRRLVVPKIGERADRGHDDAPIATFGVEEVDQRRKRSGVAKRAERASRNRNPVGPLNTNQRLERTDRPRIADLPERLRDRPPPEDRVAFLGEHGRR